jgi:hypothetical protein
MRLKHVKTMLAERHQLDNGLPGCLVSNLNHEIRGFLTDEKAAPSETINNSQVARAILVRVLQIVMSVSIYHHFGFPINLSSRGTHTCVHTCTRSDNTAWKVEREIAKEQFFRLRLHLQAETHNFSWKLASSQRLDSNTNDCLLCRPVCHDERCCV